MVAVPDGELRRRLIGVEHLRQGWGRKRAGIARTGRPATGQPTRGTRTTAHASAPRGTWLTGPDERRFGRQNWWLRFESVFDSLCRRGWWALTCTNTDVGWDLNRCS